MSLRYMRVILFYDLPSITFKEKKSYRKFHDFIIKEGFIQLQESVYTKLALNSSISNSVINRIKSNTPKDGLVQLLVVTEKQFAQMEYICGEYVSNKLASEERLVIL